MNALPLDDTLRLGGTRIRACCDEIARHFARSKHWAIISSSGMPGIRASHKENLFTVG